MNQLLKSKTFFGRHMWLGLLPFTVMTVIMAEIADQVEDGAPLTLTDIQLSNWLHVHRSPLLTKALWLITSLHATIAVSSIAVIFSFYLLWKRRPYWLAATLLSVFGGMTLNKYLKLVFQRARPHFDDPILMLTSYSFPSGHTMMATVLYGVLAAFLITKINAWSWRVLIVTVAGCLIALVGFSRIYLGAHYLSDVLAAMAEGFAWLALCLTVVYSVWKKRSHRPES